ncbi:C3a anaphylatoxin chemotactic receptor-like [Syngnathus acus]|uniref:C3a anaphylatoxin chemotactic receptor-like n=1 Tax=Syngnathus acus TaxID=161584 RepID=UPI001885C388|nr:C3a anaphylatoxin chemotactic receptor-like [Syngnathus acus]
MVHRVDEASALFLNASPGVASVQMSDDSDMDVVALIFNVLTVLLGLPGNGIVILVVGFRLKATVLNVWLVNLATADLIFCVTRIFSLVRVLFLNHWPFGLFMCRLKAFFKYTNMFCSVFMLAIISVDRAACVWLPVLTRRRRTVCAARLVTLGTWVGAVTLSWPFFHYRGILVCNKNLSSCILDDKIHTQVKTALYVVRFLCGFLIPFTVILACYILAGVGIRRTRLTAKTRPLRLMALLVCAFFMCWAPYHGLHILRLVDSRSLWDVLMPTAKGLAFFHSCVNPFLYFFVGYKMKGWPKKCLPRVFKSAMDDNLANEIGQSNYSIRDRMEIKLTEK